MFVGKINKENLKNLANISPEAEKQFINYVLKTKVSNWGV